MILKESKQSIAVDGHKKWRFCLPPPLPKKDLEAPCITRAPKNFETNLSFQVLSDSPQGSFYVDDYQKEILDIKEEKFRRIIKIFGHVSLEIVILELEKPFRSFKIETFSTKKGHQIFERPWEKTGKFLHFFVM